MRPLRIIYLLLISSGIFFTNCTPVYKKMQVTTGNVNSLLLLKPVFNVALYKTEVDVVGNHLSGLLIIKKMPDSSTRIVFSNEMGFKFFDFEFSSTGNFKVYSVIKQMNKKSVLKTLRNDFALILMERLDTAAVSIRKKNGLWYYVFPAAKGYNYYVTDSSSNTLIQMERASKTKTVVTAITNNYNNGIPDTIGITHHTFAFTIGLKKIDQ